MLICLGQEVVFIPWHVNLECLLETVECIRMGLILMLVLPVFYFYRISKAGLKNYIYQAPSLGQAPYQSHHVQHLAHSSHKAVTIEEVLGRTLGEEVEAQRIYPVSHSWQGSEQAV